MKNISVLVPIEITSAMITSSTIAEPAAGETAWVSAGTYTKGQEVISTATHRVYSALIDHAGRTTTPDLDRDYWNDERATMKFLAFDADTSSQGLVTTPFTYVLRPRLFFNAVVIYAPVGAAISVVVKDAPGGSVIYTFSSDLYNLPLDWYDWGLGVVKMRSKLILSDITPYPDAELTITITGAPGASVGAGMIAVGDLRPLMGDAQWGGVEYGATAEPVNFGFVGVDKWGKNISRPGRVATDMRFRVQMPKDVGDYFLGCVQDALTTAAAWICTDLAGYDGLNVFGIGTGTLSYDNGLCSFSGYVKGVF